MRNKNNNLLKLILMSVMTFSVLMLNFNLVNADSQVTEVRTDTDSGYRLDYIDSEGNLVRKKGKPYATIVRTVENSKMTSEFYYDENGNPATVGNYFGFTKSYEDNWVVFTYVDMNYKPIMNSSGYAIKRQILDNEDRVVQENYYDTNDNLIIFSDGHCGILNQEFNEENKVTKFTYLDELDRPSVLSSGYSTVIITYSDVGDCKLKREMFFYLDGNPAMHKTLHVYGKETFTDKNGLTERVTYLDQNGEPTASANNYSTVKYKYDRDGRQIGSYYFDIDGNPCTSVRGRYGEVVEYSAGVEVDRYFVDASGNRIFYLDEFLFSHVWLVYVIAFVLLVFTCLLPEKMRYLLLIAYVAFIMYMTLFVRETGDVKYELNLLSVISDFIGGVERRREVLNNILLFVPLGGILYSICSRKVTMVIPLCFSVVVELIQLVTGLGCFELSDLIGNGLGGVIGWLVVMLLMNVFEKINKKKVIRDGAV